MTREEAINIISRMIKDEEGFLSDDTVEAHKMALKALEQKPSGDAISRKIITAFLSGLISDETERKKALQYINELPPVKHQETVTEFADRCRERGKMRKGHWIYKQYGGYPEQGNYHCSECDKIDNNIPLYCPNCGCHMVEPQEREVQE